MFGKGGLGGLMKQAQQMQERMQKNARRDSAIRSYGRIRCGLS